MTAQKDTKKYITSDSQVNSNFPYRIISKKRQMHTLKRLKEGIFNSSVEVSKSHGKEKKKEKTGERKVYSGYEKKGSKGGVLVFKGENGNGGSTDTSQNARIGFHIVPGQKPLAEVFKGKKQIQSNRLKYVNMEIQEKRRLYRCGDNFLTNEQIPSWAEARQLVEGDDHSIIQNKLESKEIFQADMTLNQKVALWFGDITRLEIDVIVNSTNSILLLEQRGVNKAICDAAGPELDLELRAEYLIDEDTVFKTLGFRLPAKCFRLPAKCFRLPAKWIFHLSGPSLPWDYLREHLSMCYTNALNVLKENNCRTIAFPCISAGNKGIPLALSAEIALKAVRKWLDKNQSCVDKVIFCVHEKIALDVYKWVMSTVYPTKSIPELLQFRHSVTTHSLPAEILRMDNKSIELFKTALEDGKERDYNIRLMVVGPFGVGKTTFTKRLLCQDVNISERKSTDGIDVHVGKCRVSLKTLDWTVDLADTTDDITLKRLAKILGSTSKADTEGPLCQNLRYSDSGGAEEREDILTNKSDEALVEAEMEMQNKNSDQVLTNVSSSSRNLTDFDFVDGTVSLNDGDSISSPMEQHNSLVKELKEVVEAGDSCEDDESAVVSVWDFGGQFVFYTTHQMFLSHRAIYILVNDFSQHIGDLVMDDEPYFDCSGTQSLRMEDFIDIWLNSIHGHSKYDRPGEPPVLLVGTHTDKLSPEQTEEQIEAMFDAIRNRFAGKDASLHFTDKDFGLSNATEDPKFNELRMKIIDVAKQQSHWGELKPAKWIPLERSLEELRKSGIEIVSRTTMEELNNKLSVPIASEEELDLFLRFQHEVANIMYFSLPELRNKIVLTPQFLVNALKSLITAEMFCKKRPEVLDSWLEFRQKGILKPNLLDAVWKNCENKRFEENRDHILALMEHLNIIARPVNYDAYDEDDDCIGTQERDHFLVPCMLKESPPDFIFQSEDSFISTPCLCMVLDNLAFPSAVFNRLLVACMSRWPVARRGKKYLVYCGCGQFDVDVQHRLTLSFSANVIGLRIVRYCETDRHPSGTVCKDVYSVVKQTLRKIEDGLSLVLNYKEFVKCPLGREDSFDCLHAVEKVKDCQEFPCHSHDHVEILHSCDMLKYWFDAEDSGKKLDSSHQQFPQSLPAKVLYRIPTDKQLAKVSKGVGKEYLQLALELGLSQSRIDQIRGSCPLNVRDQIMQLLIEWRKQRGHYATFRELEKAMKSVGIDTVVALQEINL